MIDEILSGLYRIEVPLPRNPLKFINSYVIKGEDRFLVIDTGMNLKECILALRSGLQKLNVDLLKTDFFVTHLHHDHMGLVSTLASQESRVYFNQIETAVLMGVTAPQRWAQLMEFYVANGFPAEHSKTWIANRPASLFGPKLSVPFTILKDGDKLEIGDYHFICIQTPGHSPCHTCLYEKERKILVSGDHILFDITPNITYWPELDNSLGHYLQSLDKVYHLDVTLVLPGHRKGQNNHQKRIRELFEHHKSRLGEVMAAVADGEKTAYEIAPYIKWDISYNSWEQFPVEQKYFAFGETISHAEYLFAENKLKKSIVDKTIRYSLV